MRAVKREQSNPESFLRTPSLTLILTLVPSRTRHPSVWTDTCSPSASFFLYDWLLSAFCRVHWSRFNTACPLSLDMPSRAFSRKPT